MSSELNDAVRSIVERNQRSRADYAQLSARVVSLTLHGTEEEIDGFTRELDERFHKLLQGAGEDPAASGADSGATHESDGSGEPPQQ